MESGSGRNEEEVENAPLSDKEWMARRCQDIGVRYTINCEDPSWMPMNMPDQLMWRNIPDGSPIPGENTVTLMTKCPWIFRKLDSREIKGEKPGSNPMVERLFTGHMRDPYKDVAQPSEAHNPYNMSGVPVEWWASGLRLSSFGSLILRSKERQRTITSVLAGDRGGPRFRPVIARWYQDLRPDGNCAYAYRWMTSSGQGTGTGFARMPCKDVGRVFDEDDPRVGSMHNETKLFTQQWEPASWQHRMIWNHSLEPFGRTGYDQAAETYNPAIKTTAALPWYVQRKYDYSLLDPEGKTCDLIAPDYPTEQFGFFREGTKSSKGPAGPWQYYAGALDGHDPDVQLDANSSGKVDDKYRKEPYNYRVLETWWKNTSWAELHPGRKSVPDGVRRYGPKGSNLVDPGTEYADFRPTEDQKNNRRSQIAALHAMNATYYQNPDTYARPKPGASTKSQEKRRRGMRARLIRAGMTPYGGEEEFFWHKDVGSGPSDLGTGPDVNRTPPGLNRKGVDPQTQANVWKSGFLRKKIWCGNGVRIVLSGGSKDPTTGFVDQLQEGPQTEEQTILDPDRHTHYLRWKWIFKPTGTPGRQGVPNLNPVVVQEADVVLVDLGHHAPPLFADKLMPAYAQISGRDIQVRKLEQFVKWDRFRTEDEKEKKAEELRNTAKDAAKRNASKDKEANGAAAAKAFDRFIGPNAEPKDRNKRVLELGHFTEKARVARASGRNLARSTTYVRVSKKDANILGTAPDSQAVPPVRDRCIDISGLAAATLPFLREGDIVKEDVKLREIEGLFEEYKLTSAKAPRAAEGTRLPYSDINPPFPASKVPPESLLSQAEIDDDVQVVFFATNPSYAYGNRYRPFLPHNTTAEDLDLLNRPYAYQRDASNQHNTPALWRMSNFVNYPVLRKCRSSRMDKGDGGGICFDWPNGSPEYEKNADKAKDPYRYGIGVGPFVNAQKKRGEYDAWKKSVQEYQEEEDAESQDINDQIVRFLTNADRYRIWYYQLVEETKNPELKEEAAKKGVVPPKRWHPFAGNKPGMPNSLEGMPLGGEEMLEIGFQPWERWPAEPSGLDQGYCIPPHPNEILNSNAQPWGEQPPPPEMPLIEAPALQTDQRVSLKMKNLGEQPGVDWLRLSLSMFDDKSFSYIWSKVCKFGWPEPDTSAARKPPDFVKVGQPRGDSTRKSQECTSHKEGASTHFDDAHNHAFVVGYALYNKGDFNRAQARDPAEQRRLAIQKAADEEEAQLQEERNKSQADRDEGLKKFARELAESMNPGEQLQEQIQRQQRQRSVERSTIRKYAAENGPEAFYDPLPDQGAGPSEGAPQLTYRDWTDQRWWSEFCKNPRGTDRMPGPPPGNTEEAVLMRRLNSIGGIRYEDEASFNERLKAWEDTWEPPSPGEPDENQEDPVIAMKRLTCQPWRPRRHEADYSAYADAAEGGPYGAQKRCNDYIGIRTPETAEGFADRRNAWPTGCDDFDPEKLAQAERAAAAAARARSSGGESYAEKQARRRQRAQEARAVQKQKEIESKLWQRVMDAPGDEDVERIRAEYESEDTTDGYAQFMLQLVQDAIGERKRLREEQEAAKGVLDAAADASALELRLRAEAALAAAKNGDSGGPSSIENIDRAQGIMNAVEAALRRRFAERDRKRTALLQEVNRARDEGALENILQKQQADLNALSSDNPSQENAIGRAGYLLDALETAIEQRKKELKSKKVEEERIAQEFKDSKDRKQRREALLREKKTKTAGKFEAALKGRRRGGDLAGTSGDKSTSNGRALQELLEEYPQADGEEFDPKMLKMLQGALGDEEEDEEEAMDDDQEDGEGEEEGRPGEEEDEEEDGEGYPMDVSAAFGKLERVRWRALGAGSSPDSPGWYARLGGELAAMSGSELHAVQYALSDLELSASRECREVYLTRAQKR